MFTLCFITVAECVGTVGFLAAVAPTSREKLSLLKRHRVQTIISSVVSTSEESRAEKLKLARFFFLIGKCRRLRRTNEGLSSRRPPTASRWVSSVSRELAARRGQSRVSLFRGAALRGTRQQDSGRVAAVYGPRRPAVCSCNSRLQPVLHQSTDSATSWLRFHITEFHSRRIEFIVFCDLRVLHVFRRHSLTGLLSVWPSSHYGVTRITRSSQYSREEERVR